MLKVLKYFVDIVDNVDIVDHVSIVDTFEAIFEIPIHFLRSQNNLGT